MKNSKSLQSIANLHTQPHPLVIHNPTEKQRTVKNIMQKCEDPYLGLLAYRTVSLHHGLASCELMIGRKLRGTVLLLPSLPEKKVKIEQKETAERKKCE